MPYKDKEKERESKRKYDKKKREVRGETWALIGYPESLPENWRDLLADLHIPVLISPLHDADLNATGETKKPHYHIVLLFDSLKSLTQVKEIAEKLNTPNPQKQDSRRGICRYLCHLDNPEKAHYEPSDVQALGGADYLGLITGGTDKYDTLSEMIEFVTDQGITSFATLYRYAMSNNQRWFRALSDNCAYVMTQYMKSLHWESMEIRRSDPYGAYDGIDIEAASSDQELRRNLEKQNAE